MKICTMKLWHVSFVTLLICCYGYAADQRTMPKKTYIVHMYKSSMPLSYDDHLQWYESSIKAVSNSANMIYTYNNVIHGFSTRLTTTEAESLEGQPGILLVQEEMIYQFHTTRTPEFLGLDDSTFINLKAGAVSEIIIGVPDTGVWPESRSFDDTGLGPIPSKWRGMCEVSKNFSLSSCNRKLIGARSFSKGYEATYGPIDETLESKSPRDDEGHGTHTSTTAAGSPVTGASLFNYAMGTARGVAAHARVATYKVCWLGGCFSSDILAGLEMAVSDGVDVLSLSLGGSVFDYFRDTIAVGTFSAMSHGIFVSCSAGNAGPDSESLSNVAPWITTVGAGTLDRNFPASAILGNGKNFSGVSLYSGKALSNSLIPLVYASKTGNTTNGTACTPGSLDPKMVAGKIVVCDRGVNSRVQKGVVVRGAGGVGMILANTEFFGEELVADPHLIAAASVGKTAVMQ
ncbi:subtilisin-like protease SBT1.8 [Heracleum sosnowskyi]|uniref:Subtilisin-like protease SBT1.8 n=1 Tax=Heracleum sosnowskyi TaxID=360622 RepID=A0AAD8IWZ8_9APIA|nr:subtilisin-like protease SBT1.8 [Heracleum sosnowskyi]